TWAPGGLRARELALEVPTTPAAIAPAMTTLLTGMSAADFLSIAKSHRQQLDAAGVLIADLATTRWAAGQGREYLEVARTDDEPPQLDRVFAAMKGVADADQYLAAIDGIAGKVIEF